MRRYSGSQKLPHYKYCAFGLKYSKLLLLRWQGSWPHIFWKNVHKRAGHSRALWILTNSTATRVIACNKAAQSWYGALHSGKRDDVLSTAERLNGCDLLDRHESFEKRVELVCQYILRRYSFLKYILPHFSIITTGTHSLFCVSTRHDNIMLILFLR